MYPTTIGNLHDYYAHRARWIAERDSRADASPDEQAWQQLRPQMHQRLMRSLGLQHLPPKCDLRATETGTFSGPGYKATKLVYQLLPDCWGSAHLYRPADVADDERTPGVLYTCGHNLAGVIGYQQHAIAWAQRGYTCLIFDTIAQHDNPGDHHAFNRGHAPFWVGLGYSAAGGEVFNGIRALDLLLSQPNVDPQRVGVTGLSGGGAQSFLLGLVDDRLKAVATLCGVSDPAFAIEAEQVHQHCDCMYLRNVFGCDIAAYAALLAPRALLYCFARHDQLFTIPEFRSLFERTRARFDTLGCGDHCAHYEYDGPHGYNHRDTSDAIHAWFDRHVAGSKHPESDPLGTAERGDVQPERTLSTVNGITPEPNRLHLLPQLLSPRGQVRLPDDAEHWRQIKAEVTDRLRHEVLPLLDDVQQAQEIEQTGDWVNGRHHRAKWVGRLDGMEQHLLQICPIEKDYHSVIVALGERPTPALPVAGDALHAVRAAGVSVLGVQPRASGVSAFCEQHRNRLTREGCLVGLTPTMVMLQDLAHLWPKISAMPQVQGRKLYLYGKGEGAIAALYHAILHGDELAGVFLEDLPCSFMETQHQILGVMRIADISEALGLVAPTRMALVNPQGTSYAWYFAQRAYARLDVTPPTMVTDLPAAFDAMLGSSGDHGNRSNG